MTKREMARIERRIDGARRRVQKEISGFASRPHHGNGPNYAAGLASEGYNGGYRDALSDVMAVLRGTPVSRYHSLWWDE
jgi:hypothetical protein